MDTSPHVCVGLRLYPSLTQAVACFSRRSRLTVSAHLCVFMTTDMLRTVFVAFANAIYNREFVYLVVRRSSSVVCASTLGTHTQNWTVLLMPVILGTIVMRWRRRPRKRSITLTTGSSRPSTSGPVVSATSLCGCPVSARTSTPS